MQFLLSEVMCAVVSSSLRSSPRFTSRVKDRRVIRHQWTGPHGGRPAPKRLCRKSETFTADLRVPGPQLCPPSLRSARRLKGRSVTDDVLASAGEKLHLPVPRVSVHCTGQRSKGTAVRPHDTVTADNTPQTLCGRVLEKLLCSL